MDCDQLHRDTEHQRGLDEERKERRSRFGMDAMFERTDAALKAFMAPPPMLNLSLDEFHAQLEEAERQWKEQRKHSHPSQKPIPTN